MTETDGYVLNQTMLRIKDPAVSVPFYENVLGMRLLGNFDFPEMEFGLFFLGYSKEDIPEQIESKAKWVFKQPALLELTHNYGTDHELSLIHI